MKGPMTRHEIVIQEKIGTTTETEIGIGTETGKETVGETVIELVTETGRETVAVTMIEIGNVIVTVLGRGNVTEIMTMQAMKETVGSHMTGILTMIIWNQSMMGSCLK